MSHAFWNARRVGALLPLAALLALPRPCAAQNQPATFTLHFENTLTSAQGTAPTQADGVTFVPGVIGATAAEFPDNNNVRYPANGAIHTDAGTLEFWIKPDWNGNDSVSHSFLLYGEDGGGMLFAKDGANNLRSIFNQYSVGGQSEKGIAINVSDWQAGQWHHVAYTWSNPAHTLELYVDGSLRASDTFTGTLPAISSADFQIGAEGGGNFTDAALDELQFSAGVRSASEIARDYLAGLNASGLQITPTTLQLLQTWTYTPALTATVSGGQQPIPPGAAQWSSSNLAVATVDSNGKITAVSAGQATITATYNGASASLALTVTAPVLPPVVETYLDPFLTRPADGFLYEMPVLIIRYLPTTDGVNVDGPTADFYGPLSALKSNIDRFDIEVKYMLEEGSRFRGYKDPLAKPSLGYRVAAVITVYEPLPPDLNPAHSPGGSGVYFPDYNQIMTRWNGSHYVNDLGVKEVWLWGYHHGNIVPAESDMASPTTGDISNSYRFADDLPIYNHTYTLYNYNFTRSSNEAVHDHGHQQEAILSYAAQVQDGTTDFFWHLFVGQNSQGQFITGRAGWTHMPPNTTSDYDYYNTAPVLSDIEDWTPQNIGQKKYVNADTWGSLVYNWPYNHPPEDLTQHQWYVYWFQNYPGLNNTIPDGTDTLTNWWRFTGDYDNAIAQIASQGGLHSAGASVSGVLTLEGIAPNAAPQNVTFAFRPTDGSASFARTGTVNANGAFDLTGIPRNSYRVRVKSDHYLAVLTPVDTRSGNASNISAFLPAGDSNNDNSVDSSDFGILIGAFNTSASVPGSGYDPGADLNGDGLVDSTDFGLLIGEFNTVGAE